MSEATDTLYELLPAYLRNRDWYEGQPLRALMAVMERQQQALSNDIDRLYDNWFVETCENRLLPLVGALVGVSVPEDDTDWPGYRALVANALTYRQRKGTPQVLAKVAADATGWACEIVPATRTLSTTRSLRVAQRDRGSYVNVRRGAQTGHAGDAIAPARRFCQISGPREGLPLRARSDRQSLGTIAIAARRLNRYRVYGRTPRKILEGCYTFHPLGFDQALHRAAVPFDGDLNRAIPWQCLPSPLTRTALATTVDALRRDARDPEAAYVAGAFALRGVSGEQPLDPRLMAVADLSTWRRPGIDERVRLAISTGGAQSVPVHALIDPELGRFSLSPGIARQLEISVDYCYAFGADIGGGPYPRDTPEHASEPLAAQGPAPLDAHRPVNSRWFESINDALGNWPVQRRGIIRLADSRTYGGFSGLKQTIRMPAGSRLHMESMEQAAPCFIGDIVIEVSGEGPPPELVLSGLWIGGNIRSGNPVSLRLHHCTVADVSGAGEPAISCSDPRASVHVEACVVGSVRMHGDASLQVSNSIVGSSSNAAIAGVGSDDPGPVLRIQGSTVLGSVHVSRLSVACDSLFRDPVMVENRQSGRMNHCYIPCVSETPPRSGCQPDTALAEAGGKNMKAELTARIRPGFMSLDSVDAHFAQLSPHTPLAITQGAANGGELGAFNGSEGTARVERLRHVLEDYLPWGLKPFMVYLD